MTGRLLILLPLALPLYLIRFKIGPLPTTVLEAYILTLVVEFAVTYPWKNWRQDWQRVGAWRWSMPAWLVVTLVAVFTSPNLWTGFGLWRAYVLEPLLVFVMLVACIKTEEQFRDLRRSLYVTVLILVGWAAIQFATGWGIPHPWDVSILAGRRATGPFPYPNALSLFVAPVGAWAFCLWLQDRTRLLSLVTAIAALIGIALAKSNGGALAFLVVSFVALVWSFLGKTKGGLGRIWSGSILGMSLAALVAVLSKASWRAKLVSVLTMHEWSGQVRLFQWRETWQMLMAHPLFGAGFGGYPSVFKAFHKATAIEIFQYPHNILLNFWSETGLLGVAVFLWIVFVWIRRAQPPLPPLSGGNQNPSLIREGQGWVSVHFASLAPLLVILIHGLVDVPYFKNDLAILFWLLAFLTTFPLVENY